VARGFNFLRDQLGMTEEKNNGLTVRDYINGFTVFAFDLTPDSSADEQHFSKLQNGTVWCDITFAEPLREEITLLYYMQFEKLANIDKDRNIRLDADL
jgi:hypothetical protein